MVETGSILPLWLHLASIALPLVTALWILFHRSFREETLTLLMLLSLLLFSKNILLYLSAFNISTTAAYYSLFETGEFVLLILLFRSSFTKSFSRAATNYLLVAFLSVILTLHFSRPDTGYLKPVALVQAALLVFFSLANLSVLIKNQYVFIFHSPLFWIAGGTFFYCCMVLAAELISKQGWLNQQGEEKILLIACFALVRLVFYFVAAIINRHGPLEDELRNITGASPEHRYQQ